MQKWVVDAPGADRMPSALEGAGGFGASVDFGPFDAAVRIRYLGRHPPIEADRVRSPRAPP